MTAIPSASAGQRYLTGVIGLLQDLSAEQWTAIRMAAERVAETVAGGGLVHAFGTGHSHMLAEELFYRAGGLAAVNPILVESLMLHGGAENSTRLERQSGLAPSIFAGLQIREGDTLIVASNSGGNAVCDELTQLFRDAGAHIVAILSRRHAHQSSLEGMGPRLIDLADVVIDNHGAVGDASVDIDGLAPRVGPTSTVIGTAIVNAIVSEAVEILIGRENVVEVFSSSNVAGGDAANAGLVARYRKVVRAL